MSNEDDIIIRNKDVDNFFRQSSRSVFIIYYNFNFFENMFYV